MRSPSGALPPAENTARPPRPPAGCAGVRHRRNLRTCLTPVARPFRMRGVIPAAFPPGQAWRLAPKPAAAPCRPTADSPRNIGPFRGVTTMSTHHRPTRGTALAFASLLALAATAHAQQQIPSALPSPRLLLVTPPGARAGTSVEVTLTGTDLESPDRLVFSHPGD